MWAAPKIFHATSARRTSSLPQREVTYRISQTMRRSELQSPSRDQLQSFLRSGILAAAGSRTERGCLSAGNCLGSVRRKRKSRSPSLRRTTSRMCLKSPEILQSLMGMSPAQESRCATYRHAADLSARFGFRCGGGKTEVVRIRASLRIASKIRNRNVRARTVAGEGEEMHRHQHTTRTHLGMMVGTIPCLGLWYLIKERISR